MILSLKELFVVLVIAVVVFRLAKPAALLFIAPEDFSRRRNVWCLLTIAAFLSPGFWYFAIVAIPVMVIAGRRDSNPAALYLLLLQVIPPVNVAVPMIGMPYLFEINNYLLLSFCIMTPLALRIMRSTDKSGMRGLGITDIWLLAYGILTSILYVHMQTPGGGLYPGSMTESMRRGFVFFFGIFVPYFSISRTNTSRGMLVDSMATYSTSCAVLAGIAMFETAKHWLLYGEMADNWSEMIVLSSYLERGTSLRAMVSTGHSMALGYMLVVGFGFWLYLQTRVASRRLRTGTPLLYWGGLLASYTRGAWIGSVLVYFLFAALRPQALPRIAKAIGVSAVVAFLVYLSPLADRIASVLPMLGGSVDNATIYYRQRLFDRTWEIIQHSPWLGDQAALLELQDLRQGQGIVDFVNTYVGILLDNGFVGLTLFLSFIMVPLSRTWSASRRIRVTDPDLGLLGANLVSCVITMLVLWANGSFLGGPQKAFYALISLCAGYVYLGRSWQRKS